MGKFDSLENSIRGRIYFLGEFNLWANSICRWIQFMENLIREKFNWYANLINEQIWFVGEWDSWVNQTCGIILLLGNFICGRFWFVGKFNSWANLILGQIWFISKYSARWGESDTGEPIVVTLCDMIEWPVVPDWHSDLHVGKLCARGRENSLFLHHRDIVSNLMGPDTVVTLKSFKMFNLTQYNCVILVWCSCPMLR